MAKRVTGTSSYGIEPAHQRGESFIPCRIATLPEDLHVEAAATAVDVNPMNAPRALGVIVLTALLGDGVMEPPHLAMLTTKYWGTGGVKLGVYFMDTNDPSLKARILSYMNAWGQWANVVFSEASASLAQVRIARTPGQGYWSYLGTDILHIPRNQPTMNLEGFTTDTPESEYIRVIKHETGHTLGLVHEHLRKALVARLNVQKTIAYFEQTQGWSEAVVRAQVLTPIDEGLLTANAADVNSIMCYQLPGSITTDGQPIVGGTDIDTSDASLVAKLYPKTTPPAPPPPPPIGGTVLTVTSALAPGTYRVVS